MKFRIKIMLCMVALMALLFGIGGTNLIMISFQKSLERERELAGNSYRLLIQTLQALDDVAVWTDGEDVSVSLENLMKNGNTLWSGCRLSAEEKVYYRQGDDVLAFADASDQADEDHYAIFCVREGDRTYMQISGILKIGSETLSLDVLSDITSVYEMRAQQEQAFYRIFLILLLTCIVIAYLLSWILTRSLMRLSRASREIARGNLSFRSGLKSTDEIGALSRDFDHMAQQVEQSMEDIREAMQRQEEFMGSFAHELKTPMTSVIGYADLIRSRILSPEEQTEAAEYIFSEGKRLESLSLKLLSVFLADKQELSFQRVSPGEIICDLAEHLSAVYQKFGVRIDTDCQEGLCVLEPDLFRTMLENLTDNARKALDDGGNIRLGCRMSEGGCRIWCEDDGRGIPQESIPRLTEAFYRVDKSRSRAQGGAGLGLTLCARICEIHNGRITVESAVGQGTTVTAELRGGAI